MIETILVADDGSDNAAKGVRLASNLAAKFGSKVVIMNAVQPEQVSDALLRMAEAEHLVPAGTDPGAGPGIPSDVFAAVRRSGDAGERRRLAGEALGRQVLDRAEAAARSRGAKDVSTVMALGDPAKEIIAQADAVKADMIVMGTRGLGDLEGLLIGSVSHKVTSHAACTCVLVK